MSNQRKLRILYSNANHSPRAMDAALIAARDEEADVIAITEPHPDDGHLRAPGWKQVCKKRVALLIRNDVRFTPLASPHDDVVAANVGRTSIVCAYASPNEPLDDKLTGLSDTLLAVHDNATIVGDFNCRTALLPGHQSNARGRRLEEFIRLHGLALLNDATPTYHRAGCWGVNDYFLAPAHSAAGMRVRLLAADSLSDHALQLITIDTETEINRRPPYTRLNLERLVREVEQLDLGACPTLSSPEHIDEYALHLQTQLQGAIDAASERLERKSPIHWWTAELSPLKRLLGKVNTRLRRSRDPISSAILREVQHTIRQVYRKAMKEAKHAAWRDFCTSDRPWGKAYTVSKGSERAAMPYLRREDGTYTKSEEESTALLLATKFSVDPGVGYAVDTANIRGSAGPPPKVTAGLVTKLIKNLANRKAPGPDRVNHKTLKTLQKCHPAVLPRLYTACLTVGHFPALWKRGRVVFVPKPRKDPELADSYRPITLLSVLGKTLERVLKTHIDRHLEDDNLLDPRQYGFRAHRSTEDAVVAAVATIKQHQSSHAMTAVLSLDIRGAFDNACWTTTMLTLQEMRFPHFVVATLGSYFSNRHIINGDVSWALQRGCPQGSVLGPVLWNISFNSTLAPISPGVSVQAYADDTLLICSAENFEELRRTVALATNTVIARLAAKGLELNASKTEALLLCRRITQLPDLTQLPVGEGTVVRPTTTMRYLGVTLDDQLTWVEHIRQATDRAVNSLPVLTRICTNMFGYSYRARRTMVQGCVQTHLLYCSSVWYHRAVLKTTRQPLMSVQRKAALLCIRGYRTVSQEAALILADLVPIDLAIHERSVLWLLRRGLPVTNWGPYPTVTRTRTGKFQIAAEAAADYTDDEADDDLTGDSEEEDAAVAVAGGIPFARLAKLFRRITEKCWGKRWEEASTGRWTHSIFPSIGARRRSKIALSFWTTQALTGHGCFAAYLHKMHRRDTPQCECEGEFLQSAEHVLTECALTGPHIPVPSPTASPAEWRVWADFAAKTVRRLWEAENPLFPVAAATTPTTSPPPTPTNGQRESGRTRTRCPEAVAGPSTGNQGGPVAGAPAGGSPPTTLTGGNQGGPVAASRRAQKRAAPD